LRYVFHRFAAGALFNLSEFCNSRRGERNH